MVIDLRSDTVTRPTPAMRDAIRDAVVGDDVWGDDPTVAALEARAAALTGKAAALFVPSGTMANLIAIAGWTRPGEEVLMDHDAHPFHYEAGGAAAVAGVQIRLLRGASGVFDAGQLESAIRPADPHYAPATLVCIEDTANRGGGTVWPLDALDAVMAKAHDRGLAVHIDGARQWNAVIASGVPFARRALGADSVTFCLSKGLGCPAGSLLCGPAPWIERARRLRKMLGGAMRQAGVLAAAGLYALDHHVNRLADDHRRARALADGLRDKGVSCVQPATNLVFADVPDAAATVAHLAARGVLISSFTPTRVRAVLHLDVDDDGVARAIEAWPALR